MGVKRENIKQFYKITIPYDWEITRIGKHVTKIGSGSTPRGGEKVYTSNGIPFIRSQNVNNNQLLLKNLKYIPESIHLKMSGSRVIANDILLNITGASIGRTCVVPNNFKEGNVNQHVCIIRTTKGLYNHFLQLYLFSNIGQIAILKSQVGGNREGLNHSNVRSLKVPLPPLPEQKAIAKALGLMDKAININNKLIAQKELRKKWLMQNLLSGKKRLKGFSGEWEETQLGSLGETYNGLSKKSKEDFGEGKPYIPYLNIFNNSKVDDSNFDFVKIYEKDNQNKVKYGDIFFTISSETPGEVGMASVFLDNIEELYLNSFCFGFRLNDFKTLIPEFSSYFFRASAFRKEIYKLSQGVTRFNLSKNSLMKLNIILPAKEEQTAIAQILMATDKELNLLRVKTEKLKEQKKGMMQVLLTGEKRLNLDLED